MTDDSAGGVIVSTEELQHLARAGKRASLIRLTSRVGVWGLIGGLTPVVAAAFDFGIPLGLASTVMGLGLVVSGIGTAAASWLIFRELRGRKSPLKRASLAGLPLGLALTLYGTTMLWPWSPLVRALGTIVPAAVLFGVLVVVYLVIGFFREWGKEDAEVRDSA